MYELRGTNDILSEYTRVRNNMMNKNYGIALNSLKRLHETFRRLKPSKETDQIRLESRLVYLALTSAMDDFDLLFDVTFQRYLEQLGVRNATNDTLVSASGIRRLDRLVVKGAKGHSHTLPDPRSKRLSKAAHN